MTHRERQSLLLVLDDYQRERIRNHRPKELPVSASKAQVTTNRYDKACWVEGASHHAGPSAHLRCESTKVAAVCLLLTRSMHDVGWH
jgi:hypothetical protein